MKPKIDTEIKEKVEDMREDWEKSAKKLNKEFKKGSK